MKTFKELKEEVGLGKYMHCDISRNTKRVDKTDKASGNSWSEDKPMPGYYVTGGKLGQRKYNTIDNAKKAIEFDHEVQFGKFADLKPQ